MRLTLDGKPRMLALALRSDLWVAYDAEHASLYDISSQPINFDGAVYNTHHGPQPATQGPVKLTSHHVEPWRVRRGDTEERPVVQYRGHAVEKGQVVLRHRLKLSDGSHVDVEERPEALPTTRSGVVRFERRFRAVGDSGIVVLLDFDAPAIERDESIEKYAEGNGRLRILPKQEARLVFEFAPQQSVESEATSAPTSPIPPAERLMAQSDCATCHNPVNQTVGPSYKQIAERYRTNPQVIEGLAAKIRQGGGDQWGDAAMVAHPSLSASDAKTLAEYILTHFDPNDAQGAEALHPNSGDLRALLGFDPSNLKPGVALELYELGHELTSIPELAKDEVPNVSYTSPALFLDRPVDFPRPDPSTGFLLKARGWLRVDRAGHYAFRLTHDGVAQMKLDDAILIDDGDSLLDRNSPWASTELDEGLHAFEVSYVTSDTYPGVTLWWTPPGGQEEVVPESALLSLPPATRMPKPGLKGYRLRPGAAGDGRAVTRVHPSFVVHQARPHSFTPRVGGLDFLPSGQMVISTWDARGAVYVLDNLHSPEPDHITVRRFADGLVEPLGVKVVDGRIYVMQKHELTELVDNDHDGIADEYRTVSSAWGSTGNFHEFAFGLAYEDGYFYATLAIGIEPGGSAMTAQHDDRGRVIRISKKTGAIEHIARGLRTPNGIGFGTDGELFVTDNEGDWLPANKLIQVQPGAFYGSYSVNPNVTRTLPVTPPALWLPVEDIAYSPSQPLALDLGPYKNQMLYADVTYGGLNRVVLQKVGNAYQGCALPFIQGLEAGINRAAFGPDGDLYVGGIGNPGNWAQEGKLWYGLQRLEYTGAPAFEILDVKLHSEGLELTFTEPLRPGPGELASDYAITQWHYVPTAEYGGPKVGETSLPVSEVRIAPDRRGAFLRVRGIEPGHVLHLHLSHPPVSVANHELWSGDAYCTVNQIPETTPSDTYRASPATPNALGGAERQAGTRLLFDGASLAGWHAHDGRAPRGWSVRDGWLTSVAGQGTDLTTQETFGDFELDFEWRASAGSNGGVFYRVAQGYPALADAGVEFQVVDDDAHADGREPLHRSGSVYDLFAPQLAVLRPAGEPNHGRVVARGQHVEHWVNGHRVLEYEIGSPAWHRQLGASKFRNVPSFGVAKAGTIALQHNGAGVAYRNIKLRTN